MSAAAILSDEVEKIPAPVILEDVTFERLEAIRSGQVKKLLRLQGKLALKVGDPVEFNFKKDSVRATITSVSAYEGINAVVDAEHYWDFHPGFPLRWPELREEIEVFFANQYPKFKINIYEWMFEVVEFRLEKE